MTQTVKDMQLESLKREGRLMIHLFGGTTQLIMIVVPIFVLKIFFKYINEFPNKILFYFLVGFFCLGMLGGNISNILNWKKKLNGSTI